MLFAITARKIASNREEIPITSEKLTQIDRQIFALSPDEVRAIKLFTVSCGCIYYQWILSDEKADTNYGIYRHSSLGLSEECMDVDDS